MADEMNTDERAAIARAIWALMREHEDRCDEELEDLGPSHPIWAYADAARASLAASAVSDGVASLSAAEPAHEIFMMPETWHVAAHIHGEPILSIGYNWVSGKGELTEAETQAVIGMAQHLLSFVGYGLPPSSFDPDEAEPAPALTQGAAIAAGAVYAELPSECDSPEICAISKSCAGQFGSKRICASHGQAPAQPLTVAQIEEAIGLRSKAWDTIGAEKIVEAVLHIVNAQAPAQPDCLTCNDRGAIGNILTAEPCPDCTPTEQPASNLDDAFDCARFALRHCPDNASVGHIMGVLRAKVDAAIASTPSPQAAQQAPAGATSPWSRALEIRIAQGWKLKGDRLPVLYTDTINGDGVGRDDLWLCTTSALAAPAAPSTPASPTIEGESNGGAQ